MKRNFINILKYLILISFIVILTILILKFKKYDPYYANDIIQSDTVIHKIDWHDWEFIHKEKLQTGIGEQGVSSKLPSINQHEYDKLYEENGFNGLLSDSISVNRSIPDIRHKLCHIKKYNSNLPSVSVIVALHNEHVSTLLRTVYSILNRSPKSILKEIILVDDLSTKGNLKKPLDSFISTNLAHKVKIVHLKKRRGVIGARIAGARIATSEVLVFLDAHVEVNVNWLPPLLEPISEDYRTCVCPFIDVIAQDTFEYRAQDGARGAFDWEFDYKTLPLLPEDILDPSKPFRNPVMAGGLFAISSQWFWELGGYDPGLEMWGGEQYELSFKIWQCGGTILNAPCSRVGHIYRKFVPYEDPGIGDFIGKNYYRIAEVWMDEYAKYLYFYRSKRYQDIVNTIDPIDTDDQKTLRKKLNCKPFKWFMQEVAFDLVKYYPPNDPPDLFIGKIRSYTVPELCLDASSDDELTLKKCKVGSKTQVFILTSWNEIKLIYNKCLDVNNSSSIKAKITLYGCNKGSESQFWHYNHKKKTLIQGKNNDRCMEYNTNTKKVYVTQCIPENNDQKWIVNNFNSNPLPIN